MEQKGHGGGEGFVGVASREFTVLLGNLDGGLTFICFVRLIKVVCLFYTSRKVDYISY